MFYKKIGVFLLAGVLMCSMTACNTSKNAKKNEKAAEATTEVKYEKDISADELLKSLDYDVTKCVTLPKDYDKQVIDLKGQAAYSEEGFKNYVNELLANTPDYQPIKDRDVVKAGDILDVNYTETVEGEEAATQENFKLTLGQGYFDETVEKAIIGKKVGDTFEATTTYPEDFGEELAGKKAKVTGKINAICTSNILTMDTMTDQYVKDNFSEYYEGVNTVDDMLKEFKKEYQSQLDVQKSDLVAAEVQKNLLKDCKVTFPDGYLEEKYDTEMKSLEKAAKEEGVELKDFLKTQYNMTEKQFKKEIKKNAKLDLIFQAIIKDKNHAISSKAFEDAMTMYASYGGQELKDFYAEYGGKETLMIQYAEEEVFMELTESAKVK